MDRANNYAGVLYAITLCLYPVSALAQQERPVTNIAGPSASSSGSVVNQGVQVLNGPYMQQFYGAGVSCQHSSLSLTPFVNSFNNFPGDPDQFSSTTLSPGVAMTVTMPLDTAAVTLCKERAKVEIERFKAETAKAKLDFELVRLLKCGEAAKAGVYFNPNSPYAAVCADVVTSPTRPVPLVAAPVSSGEQSN